MVVGCSVFSIVERRLTRRRGRVLDGLSLRSQALRFFIVWAVIYAFGMSAPDYPDGWPTRSGPGSLSRSSHSGTCVGTTIIRLVAWPQATVIRATWHERLLHLTPIQRVHPRTRTLAHRRRTVHRGRFRVQRSAGSDRVDDLAPIQTASRLGGIRLSRARKTFPVIRWTSYLDPSHDRGEKSLARPRRGSPPTHTIAGLSPVVRSGRRRVTHSGLRVPGERARVIPARGTWSKPVSPHTREALCQHSEVSARPHTRFGRLSAWRRDVRTLSHSPKNQIIESGVRSPSSVQPARRHVLRAAYASRTGQSPSPGQA